MSRENHFKQKNKAIMRLCPTPLVKSLPVLSLLVLFFLFGGTAFAAPLTPSVGLHPTVVKTRSDILSRDMLHARQIVGHAASITSNCDDPNTLTRGPNGGILCAVASYATPCLRTYNPNNGNFIACYNPGTRFELNCQVNIPSKKFLNNSWWDVGVLPNGQFGEFSDAYMDTVWTNNTGSPSMGLCATG